MSKGLRIFLFLVATFTFFSFSFESVSAHPSARVCTTDDEGEETCVTRHDPHVIGNLSITPSSYNEDNGTIYGEDLNKYSINFNIRNDSISPGGEILITFPESFDLQTNEITSASPNLSGSFLPPNQFRFTANQNISAGSQVSIAIDYVLNGPAGSHTINVSATGFPSTSATVNFTERPATTPDADHCDWWNVVCYLIHKIQDISNLLLQFLIGPIIAFIGLIISFIGSALLTISINFVEAMASLSNDVTSSSGAAKIGFDVSLQIANVGIVISLIIIGFMTILRKSAFHWEQTLVRLIITAIVINFSFFFFGVAIDFSNRIMSIFSSGLDFSTLLNTESLASQIDPRNYSSNTGTSLIGDFVSTLLTPLFVLGFYTIAIFAMLALAIMLLIRYVALSILVIVLPFVLVLRIFPHLHVAGEDVWQLWFGKATNWLLFGPAVMFFTWLAFQMPGTEAGIAGMITKVGILIGGLLVSNKLGITGGKMAYGMAKDAAVGLGKYAIGRPGAAALKGAGSRFTKLGQRLQLQTPAAPPSPPTAPVGARRPTTQTTLSGFGAPAPRPTQPTTPPPITPTTPPPTTPPPITPTTPPPSAPTPPPSLRQKIISTGWRGIKTGAGLTVRGAKSYGRYSGIPVDSQFPRSKEEWKKLGSSAAASTGKFFTAAGKLVEKETLGDKHPAHTPMDAMIHGFKHGSGLFKEEKKKSLEKELKQVEELESQNQQKLDTLRATPSRTADQDREISILESQIKNHREKIGNIKAQIEAEKKKKEEEHGDTHGGTHVAPAAGHAPSGGGHAPHP